MLMHMNMHVYRRQPSGHPPGPALEVLLRPPRRDLHTLYGRGGTCPGVPLVSVHGFRLELHRARVRGELCLAWVLRWPPGHYGRVLVCGSGGSAVALSIARRLHTRHIPYGQVCMLSVCLVYA